MKGNILRIFLIISLIASIVAVAGVDTVSPDPDSPRIYVDPPVSSVAPGKNFTINVIIADITANESLYSWEFDMSFNNTILNATSVMHGPFLQSAGKTWEQPPVINNWEGTLVATDAFFPPWPQSGATGSGVLANITFLVKAEGETSLHFYFSGLRTYDGAKISPIDHTTVDGVFAYPLLRDIAVTGVTASPTSVPAGEPVSINVTVENEGEVAETFDVTILYDSSDIETKTVTDLAPGGSETLSFSWDTKDLVEGNYTITAAASEIGGETDTADNTYTDVVVTVTAPSSTFPVQLFVAIIIAVATMCSVVVFYLRRRRPTKP